MGRLVRRYIRTGRLYAVNDTKMTHFGVAGGGYAVTALGHVKSGITMTGWWTPLYASAQVDVGATVSGGDAAIAAIFCELKINAVTTADFWALYIANNGTQRPKGAIRISGNYQFSFDFAQVGDHIASAGDVTGHDKAGFIVMEVSGSTRRIQLYQAP